MSLFATAIGLLPSEADVLNRKEMRRVAFEKEEHDKKIARIRNAPGVVIAIFPRQVALQFQNPDKEKGERGHLITDPVDEIYFHYRNLPVYVTAFDGWKDDDVCICDLEPPLGYGLAVYVDESSDVDESVGFENFRKVCEVKRGGDTLHINSKMVGDRPFVIYATDEAWFDKFEPSSPPKTYVEVELPRQEKDETGVDND